jgi:hypothetical protein
MAGRTDFDVQIAFLGRASFEGLAASAGNGNFDVFWVNSWFHLVLRHSLSAAPGRFFQTRYDRGVGADRQALEGVSRKDAKMKERRKVENLLCALGLRLCAFA